MREALWHEAVPPLVRNRAALTGGIIIILLMLTALTVFAFNFPGDGLRDAREPRLHGTQEK